MSSNNSLYYKKAINILMDGDVDFKKLGVALAQTNPKLFIQLVDDPNVFRPVEQWHRDVKHLTCAGRKVEAIKLIREKTGFGLKEAKDISDHLQNHFAKSGLCSPYAYSDMYGGRGEEVRLSAAQKEVFNIISRSDA